jgi:hypothetical protein
MVYFQTKNTNLEWKSLVYSLAIWNILRSFGKFFVHLVIKCELVYFPPFWYMYCDKKNLATLFLSLVGRLLHLNAGDEVAERAVDVLAAALHRRVVGRVHGVHDLQADQGPMLAF